MSSSNSAAPTCAQHTEACELRHSKSHGGRPYFACARRSATCSTFEWVDEFQIKTRAPFCECSFSTRAVMRTVTGSGHSKGRLFFTCESRSCSFFSWVPADRLWSSQPNAPIKATEAVAAESAAAVANFPIQAGPGIVANSTSSAKPPTASFKQLQPGFAKLFSHTNGTIPAQFTAPLMGNSACTRKRMPSEAACSAAPCDTLSHVDKYSTFDFTGNECTPGSVNTCNVLWCIFYDFPSMLVIPCHSSNSYTPSFFLPRLIGVFTRRPWPLNCAPERIHSTASHHGRPAKQGSGSATPILCHVRSSRRPSFKRGDERKRFWPALSCAAHLGQCLRSCGGSEVRLDHVQVGINDHYRACLVDVQVNNACRIFEVCHIASQSAMGALVLCIFTSIFECSIVV